MVVIVLAALALPIGLVIWGLRSKDAKAGPPPEELREALNAIAEKGLPSTSLAEKNTEAALVVADVSSTAKSLAALVTELGGTCLEAEPASGSTRIVVSITPTNFPEFLRRAELITGQKLPLKTEDPTPALLVISLSPTAKP
jgi:hypothetical protein